MIKLLVVDDEEDVRAFLANFFRRRNVEVFTAGSGEEAVAAVAAVHPYLILLDIEMPGMNGIETLTKIRAIDLAAKVIMVTGKGPEEENAFEQCRQLGALDYIHKPLELTELDKKVMKELSLAP
ncbi:MAG: response regulator [Candidatus Omnitrophota bacterium]